MENYFNKYGLRSDMTYDQVREKLDKYLREWIHKTNAIKMTKLEAEKKAREIYSLIDELDTEEKWKAYMEKTSPKKEKIFKRLRKILYLNP